MRFTRLFVPLVLAGALVSGCGSDKAGTSTEQGSAEKPASNGVEKLEPKEILAKSQQALGEASSVRVKGAIKQDGGEIKLDLRVKGADGGTGSMTLPKLGTIQVTTIGKDVYLGGDDTFWAAVGGGRPGLAERMKGKFIKTTATDRNFGEFATFTDIKKLADELLEVKAEDKITKGPEKDLAGQKTITLVDNSEDGGTLYIALAGKPYPLQMEGAPGAKEQGKVEFLEYNQPVELKAPPAAQIVAPEQLLQG